MKNPTLSQTREGLIDGTPLNPESIPAAVVVHKPANDLLPAANESVVEGRGYCRTFPPTFSSVLDIPEEWKEKNWTSPGPWCSIEGLPNHPDFEVNLKTLELELENGLL